MRFFTAISLFLVGFIGIADAATPQQRRGNASANAAATSSNAPTTSARAAVSARGRTTPAANTSATTGARAAVSARAGKTQTTVNSGTAATTPTVSARAGKTQSVKNSGTKVAVAATNTTVSAECTAKYEGCMDAFCMLENADGGRCLCSDRINDFNKVVADIDKIKQQTLQMTTLGVEILEMGDIAKDVLNNTDAVIRTISNKNNQDSRKSLLEHLDNLGIDSDEYDDIFSSNDEDSSNPIDGKEGDALRTAAHELCVASIPECAKDMNMLTLLYSRKITGDCNAYENTLKTSQIDAQKLLTQAEQKLRESALEQYQNSNKYDLGQCTIKFKECMATTGGCGEDFTGCVGIAAAENAERKKNTKNPAAAQYTIKGTSTQISIAASSYDALMSKKPLCESVTKNCTRVADNVWDTFLHEIAPTIKSAELIAEDDLRQSCLSNISDCIANACKDNIDPNNKEASYDMCLAYPDSVQSLCKVQIDPCIAAEPNIMNYVKTTLEGMRVNACSNQLRECLTDENRCGPDYAKCAGMDAETISDLCPNALLTGCFNGDKIDQERKDYAVEGLISTIKDSLLTECQRALEKAQLTICGDSDQYCTNKIVKTGIGTTSLKYQICNNSTCYDDISQLNTLSAKDIQTLKGTVSGQIPWNNLNFDNSGYMIYGDSTEAQDKTNLPGASTIKSGAKSANITNADMVYAELTGIASAIKMTISAIESDVKVQQCMYGNDAIASARKLRGATTTTEKGTVFPNLTASLRQQIANAALDIARNNYYTELDKLTERLTTDATQIGKLAAERDATISSENRMAVRREMARKSCLILADPNTEGAKDDNIKKCSQEYGSDELNNCLYQMSGQLPLSASKDYGEQQTKDSRIFKETIYTTFSMDTLVCKKCSRIQNCKKARRGKNNRFCLDWEDPTESCEDIQF